ncbi:MAG: formimidoylglutamate deiminase [Gemmatimonadota bacterium]
MTTAKQPEVVEADLTWTGESFEPGIQVAIDAAGRIEVVGRLGRPTDRRLAHRALLPGLVSAHSHAFQRGLRGQGERFPEGVGSFWTWREAMYGLVESLDAERFRALCLQAFQEMRHAGITAVGEFHYLHHGPDGGDHAFDRLVLEAAAEAGIRLALLSTRYQTGGIDRPLENAQRRFATPSDDAFWESVDRLAQKLDPSTQTLGVAAHSVRAVPLADIVQLHEEAARRGLAFHMHVEEQRQEIEACLARYGKTPMALLNDELAIDGRFTAVHCTHTELTELERFVAAGGNVCVCPLTEANLGDGVPDLEPILKGPGPAGRLCLGSDSNARISMVEEMRWLEYGQRLQGETRGGITEEDGDAARVLLSIATLGGARSLGIEAGEIASGRWADFTTLDLEAPELAGSDADTLLAAWIFGGGNSSLQQTCVGGRWRDRYEANATGD